MTKHMKRTLSTLFAIIAIFCLTSCSSDEEDYRITGVYETNHHRDLSPPQTVINSKEELKNYIQQYLVTGESSINKELEGDFSDYSIIPYCYYTSIKPQKIEYTGDNNNITVYCECGMHVEMALPLCYFIKVKPKIPSNAKVNLVVDGTEIPK